MIFFTILALLGFINAFFLYWQHVQWKARGRKMYCLIGTGCTDVVGSPYGATFGIKNEVFGMVYYVTVIVLAYLGDAVGGIRLLPIVSGAAAAFSLYLLFIQLVVLRKYCFWCMIAITISLLLFFLIILR